MGRERAVTYGWKADLRSQAITGRSWWGFIHQVAFRLHPEKPDAAVLAVNGLPLCPFKKLQVAASASRHGDPAISFDPRADDPLKAIRMVGKWEKVGPKIAHSEVQFVQVLKAKRDEAREMRLNWKRPAHLHRDAVLNYELQAVAFRQASEEGLSFWRVVSVSHSSLCWPSAMSATGRKRTVA